MVLAATATVAYMVYDRDRAMQGSALALARSIGASVEAELNTAVATLQALGAAESLANGRLSTFEDHARTVAKMRGWRSITLIDRSDRLLFSTDDPGAAGQQAWERASVQAVFARRAPTVGAVVPGKVNPAPAFPVRIPVIKYGEVNLVLSAVLGTDRILDLLKGQQLATGHVIAIFDAGGTRVARSVDHAHGQASPSLKELIDSGGREGVGRTRTLEGETVHTAFHRIGFGNWVVAVGVPATEARNALLASLAAGWAGMVCSLALSAWMAWYFSRRVSQPIEDLKRAADALGRGEDVAPVQTDVEELRDVGAALAEAAHERIKASAERERLLTQAVDALQRAEDASRSKDEFLAVLGHELRNPLAPIASALQLMTLKGEASTVTERRIVDRQLRHMTRLVDDLLDVSRITRRQLTIRKSLVQVGPWIEQVLQSFSSSLKSRSLEVDLPQDVAGRWVQGDDVRLAQVLSNLLSNAAKFTSEQGHIKLSCRCEGPAVIIAVEDDGAGLDPQHASRVFDMFYQAPQASDRARGGLGLGLSIVRSLVEMHGGTVEVHSDGVGKGCRFQVRLPCVDAPAEETTSRLPPLSAKDLVSRRVLVVDDNRDAADTVSTLLELSGHEVRVAYTPQQALATLDGFDAQVAVLDIGLPGMDGYQLAAAIHERPQCRDTRLIALTGYGQQADVRRAHEAGFDAHLTKPVDPDLLLATVSKTDPPPRS